MKDQTTQEHSSNNNSYHKQVSDLEQKNIQLREKLAEQEHTMRKELLVLETQLTFERKKASEFETKWKEAITSTDQQSSLKSLCTQLTNDLNVKQHELNQLKKKEFEKKKKVGELEQENKKLRQAETNSKNLVQQNKNYLQQNKNLKGDIQKIKQTAVKALMDKDTVIADLEDELRKLEFSQSSSSIAIQLTEYKEKCIDLQQKCQKLTKEFQQADYENKTEINELKDRLQSMKFRTQERSASLEQDILEYQKYIDELKRQKSQETILTRSLDELQDKYKKAEKRVYDLETELDDTKTQKLNQFKKMQSELNGLRAKVDSLQQYKINFLSLQKQTNKSKKAHQKQIEQIKHQLQKLNQSKQQLMSKILQLQAQNSRLSQDIEQYKRVNNQTLAENEVLKQNFTELKQKHQQLQNWSPQKLQSTLSDDLNFMQSQQMRKQYSAVDDDRIKQLQQALDSKVSENEQLRNKIVQLSEVKISDETKNIIVQNEDYRQHINKLENNILIIKLRYAQDESFWKDRQKTERDEFTQKLSKMIREKGVLYQKLDKLRKSKGQRRNVYISALK